MIYLNRNYEVVKLLESLFSDEANLRKFLNQLPSSARPFMGPNFHPFDGHPAKPEGDILYRHRHTHLLAHECRYPRAATLPEVSDAYQHQNQDNE